jgi:uncharacterized repeat protein (TIGR03803 family)
MKTCKPMLWATTRNLTVALAAMLMMLTVSALGAEKVLYTGSSHGAIGGNNLAADSAGNIYGTTWAGGNNSTSCQAYTGIPGCGVVFKLTHTTHGWVSTVLYTFTGGADGAVPANGVILDSAGNLYGTTYFGGYTPPDACQGPPTGCGVVFELTPTAHGPWKETVLYAFTGGTDGKHPFDRLVFDSSGNLYGTASDGGDASCDPPFGCGVVFKLTSSAEPPWTESVLYTFSDGSDGGFPFAGLTFDTHGNLYGVAETGGDTSVSCQTGLPGCGVIFQLAPTGSGPWTETVLHAFTGGTDGGDPFMSVILDSGGNVYGTTNTGGTNSTSCPGGGGLNPGCGVVFELVQGTWDENVLHNFTGGADGRFSGEPLVFDSSGKLYGTTYNGGLFSSGVVFKLTPAGEGAWTENILYTFTGGSDGGGPETNLLLDPTGGLIGVTDFGGNVSECRTNDNGVGCGVVFDIHR